MERGEPLAVKWWGWRRWTTNQWTAQREPPPFRAGRRSDEVWGVKLFSISYLLLV